MSFPYFWSVFSIIGQEIDKTTPKPSWKGGGEKTQQKSNEVKVKIHQSRLNP